MKKAEEAGFSSFSEFVVFVLEQLVSEEEGGGEVFSEEDEEKVKERLRALGYIE
ncbi:CopG family transcriptional regulator [Desulfurococcaceae archaeon MEX13E-LK6-19]|nr:CopG family transcriptional regulator [Desulfurococcaceae archaeon MEX13E-LK6-19]